jgi:hypothetical protein
MVKPATSLAILLAADSETSEFKVVRVPTSAIVTWVFGITELGVVQPVRVAAISDKPAANEIKRFKALPKDNWFKVTLPMLVVGC